MLTDGCCTRHYALSDHRGCDGTRVDVETNVHIDPRNLIAHFDDWYSSFGDYFEIVDFARGAESLYWSQL